MTEVTTELLDEQAERISIIQHVAREFLSGEWSNESFRRLIESGDGYDAHLWQQICRLGWPGIMLPESAGGSDGTFSELAVIAEECGRALAPTPLVSHAVAAWIVLRAGPTAPAGLAEAASTGEAPLTFALVEAAITSDRSRVVLAARRDAEGWRLTGEKRFVPAARDAGWLIVAAVTDEDQPALFAVPRDAAGVAVTRLKPLDWSAVDTVVLDDVAVPGDALLAVGDEAREELRDAINLSDVLLTAELCGLADTALDMAVEYAKIRETYGKPIGQYQAVKHRLVNLRADIEIAKALVRAAAVAISAGGADRRVAAAQAAYWSIDALKKVPEGCLQVFGGIGFTWEHDIHLFLRRCATLASLLGDRAEHREIIVRALDEKGAGQPVAEAA